ncbi:MAG TPA: phosphoenolpyruvate carboxylase [Patescibacteria group bacterium]|nr:phosphoenolpyruvate carboxylase [Patescibacteria group bacterium]
MISIDRKIPSTMASQHPDHAAKPYWYTKEFISTRQEVKECFLTFSDLGISEYKWDWEGKFVDESVVEKLLGEHYEYFLQHPIGKDKFITFRLPNPKVETEFRLGRAFMGILAAAGLAKHVGLHSIPLFEVILPMTESAGEMIAIQEAFAEIASLKHQLYNFTDETIKHIEVIPLFESVSTIMRSDKIVLEYIKKHEDIFGFRPKYLRPYVARSDPALNSGIIPTVLAIKIALSQFDELANRQKFPLSPIIGSASLPFRGGLTPYTVKHFAEEYAGVRTALIQSAFRYDYPFGDVVKGIATLEELLPKSKVIPVSISEKREIIGLLPSFEKPYQSSIEILAPLINDIASLLPRRRERVQHTGLFGYSRGVGNVHLPRAIGFTAAMYSMGIPPELVGTGRGLHNALGKKLLPLIEKHYIGLRRELKEAGKFLNKRALAKLSKTVPALADVVIDIKYIEDYLHESLGPTTSEEREHAEVVDEIVTRLLRGNVTSELLTQAALLRKSLG